MIEDLIAAWGRWDGRPGDEVSAGALEDAVQVVAGEIGVSGTEVRVAVTDRRRRGYPVKAAVMSAYSALGTA